MSDQVQTLSRCVCPICKKVFKWESALSNHLRIMHLTTENIVHKCNKSFSQLSLLNNHEQLHTVSMSIENDHATKKKKISEIYKNVKTETLYSSDSDCEYELLQTVIKVTNVRNCTYLCEYCEKGFINSCNLKQHVIKKHTNTSLDSDVEVDSNSFETNGKVLSENELEADNDLTEDNQTQANVDSIDEDNHSDKYEIVNSPDLNAQEIITIRTVTTPSLGSNNKRHSCRVCGARFKMLSDLDNHRKLHLKQSLLKMQKASNSNPSFNRKYRCQLCKRAYSQKIYLENHVRLHESGKIYHMFEDPAEDKYLCTFCGKEFVSSSHLSVHVNLHIEGKRFLCSICGKSFALERYLLNHYKTHSQEKLFSCEYCSKRFIHKGTLVEHLRIHAGIKPHECTICDKKFTHYSGLTQHLKIHTDVKKFVCDVCGRSFRFSGHYRGHMRTHTGDKPFVCTICDRRFALSGSLVVHRRTHSGERPYQCENCKKGFIKNCNLKQHLKAHASCRNHLGKMDENDKQDDVRNECIS